ncbi:MAG TPA: hypothetical protein RMI62_12425, partial [Polyangiaceae bacterium LLY-WYZ-15_(1-7)]|nr:hypothetical protein [Polyangiaceae bacterium LLY-WYZ-15_(1-7)]
MRMVLLAPLLLTLAALWAACAVAARTGGHEGPRGVAERGVLFFALLVAPPWALGWLGAFTPVALALGSAATSALTALAATGGQPARLRAAARDAGALLAAPFRGPVELARRGAWLGAAAWALTLLVAGWVALLTWLAPSTSWDGMWYHDTMVGFAVQHRGFAWVDLPQDGMQVVNGYPRLVESLAAFFVVLGDDRWIELPALLFWPLLGAALADLAGNFTDWREGRVLFAVLMLTMPGVALELRSTYVDIPIAFLLVVALASLTRPRLGLRDLWIAALATGLLAGAKSTAAVIVPLLFALALVRLRPLTREEGRRVLGPLLAGGVLVAAFAAPLYLRNALRTGNPFWPLTLESSLLGLEFEGPIEVVVAWPPVDVWLREMYGAPMQGMYHPDVRPHGYGHALPFLLPPLLLFALPAGLRALARGSRRARAGLALAAATAGLVLATREVMWWGRFGAVPVAAVLALLVGWMAAPRHRPWARRLLALAVAV